MADTVHLHIGLPKTGTTFIQQTLWRNRQRLAEAGVHLPLGARRAHFLSAADLLGKDDWADEPGADTWTWRRLAESANRTSGRVLVSEEMLTDADQEHIEQALRPLAAADVHIIVTARDLARQIPSTWQQTIKQRGRLTLPEFLERLTSERDPLRFWVRQDLARIMRSWREHLPAGNVHLVTVPPQGEPPAVLWSRFAAAAGIDAEVELAADFPNQSLGPPEIEVLRRLNAALGERLPYPTPYLTAVRRRIAMDLAGASPAPTHIPADWRDWTVARSREMLAALSTMQLDVVGDLSDLMPEPPGGTGRSFAEREVTDAAIRALIAGAERVHAEHRRPRLRKPESSFDPSPWTAGAGDRRAGILRWQRRARNWWRARWPRASHRWRVHRH